MPMKNGYSIEHAQGRMRIFLGVLGAWHTAKYNMLSSDHAYFSENLYP